MHLVWPNVGVKRRGVNTYLVLTDVWKILSAVLRCSNVLFDSVDDGQTPPTCLNQQVRAMVIGDTSAGAAGFTSRFSRFGGSWRAGHFCYTEVILCVIQKNPRVGQKKWSISFSRLYVAGGTRRCTFCGDLRLAFLPRRATDQDGRGLPQLHRTGACFFELVLAERQRVRYRLVPQKSLTVKTSRIFFETRARNF